MTETNYLKLHEDFNNYLKTLSNKQFKNLELELLNKKYCLMSKATTLENLEIKSPELFESEFKRTALSNEQLRTNFDLYAVAEQLYVMSVSRPFISKQGKETWKEMITNKMIENDEL